MKVSVIIPFAGTSPSPDELAARNAAMASLDEVGIGTRIGAGGGMGEMDYSYRVTDEPAARSAIERIPDLSGGTDHAFASCAVSAQARPAMAATKCARSEPMRLGE